MKHIIDYVRQQAEAHRAMAATENDIMAKANLFILAARLDSVADRHEQFVQQLISPAGRGTDG